MNLRRVLSIVLALLLSVVFCSCVSETEKTKPNAPAGTTADDTTVAVTDERSNVTDGLPNLDFGGEKITVLCRGEDIPEDDEYIYKRNMYEDEIEVEELTNEVLNDAIYNRMIAVETRLNVDIEVISYGGDTSLTSNNNSRQLLEKAMNSGSDDYQIFANSSAPCISDSQKGWFYNLYDLEYFDFTQPWWYEDYNKEAEIMGRLYCANGSLSLSTLRSACAVFFNKKLANDYNVEDFYELVYSGKWTIDKQLEIAESVYTDLNGNSIKDKEDQYGFFPTGYWATDVYISAFELNILSKDENGGLVFDCNFDKMSIANEKLYKLYRQCAGTPVLSDYDQKYSMAKAFSEGKSLMISTMLFEAEQAETFRNMTDEYGIIPEPKFDEAQKEYHSNPYECATVFTIPVTNPKPDMAAAVLEALNSESYRRVISAYADMALKGKYLNDTDSRKMFDLIIDGMTVEDGQIYCYQIAEFPQWVFRYPLDWDEPDSFLTQYTTLSRKLPRILPIVNKEFEALMEE